MLNTPPWFWETFQQLSPSCPEVPTSLSIEWDLDLKLSPKSRPKSLVSLAVSAGIMLQQHSHLSGGMCCCHEEVGDVAGPSLTAAAFSSFPLAVGNTVLATDGSQLLHHFQDEVLSARSAPEATTWISLRSGEQQREGNPPDLLGAKLMAW